MGSDRRISIVRLLKCFFILQNNKISPLRNLGEHQVKYTGDNSEARPNVQPFIHTVRIYQAPIMCQVLLRHWRFLNGTELARGLLSQSGTAGP